MNNKLIDEKLLIGKSIDALAISTHDRDRARANLANADAVVGAFFAISKLLQRRLGRKG